MSTDTGNGTNNQISKECYALPTSQCLPWIVVLSTESLAVVIFNVTVIIVFLKQRQLQRQSLYLVIHLAIVDLLVGAIAGPLVIADLGTHCNTLGECDVWGPFSLFSPLGHALYYVFPSASVINLVAISLERLHATFRPLKHRFLKKWVYYVIISVIWLVVISRATIQIVLNETILSGGGRFLISDITFVIIFVISLFIFCLSYVAIYVKIRFNRHPCSQYGVTNRERRLTSMLFIAMVTSLLTLLPLAIFFTCDVLMNMQLIAYPSFSFIYHILNALAVLSFANSLANPIIYSIRMPEVRAIICNRNPNHLSAADLPLRKV